MRIGRTYVFRSDSRQSDGCRRWLCGLALVALSVATATLLWVTERDKAGFVLSTGELRTTCIEASPVNVDASLIGRLVHVSSDDVAPGQALADKGFGIAFPASWGVTRTTEYCQWDETPVSSTVQHDDGTETVRVGCEGTSRPREHTLLTFHRRP